MALETTDTLVTTRFQAGQSQGIGSDDLRAATESLSGGPGNSSAITASFTLAIAQRATIQECNHATVAINATIPPNASVAFDQGTVIGLCRMGAAAVGFIAGSGVTFIPAGVSATCRAVGSEVFARHSTTTLNTWIISGDYT